MASFTTSCDRFCFISANTIYLYDLSLDKGKSSRTFVCEKPKPKEEPGKESKEHKNGDSEGILACGLSPCAQYLVACDDYKRMWVWKSDQDATWNLRSTRELARRATSLAFPSCGRSVLIADKSGDVVSYSLEGDNDGQVLLGHVSMLLDVKLCGADNKYVITCDRDEKIRVSHYPAAYNIQAFCLGHTDFVSRLACFTEEHVLISGSGDGSIKLWNYETGNQLYSLDLTSEFEPETDNQSECEKLGQDPVTGSKVDMETGDNIMSRTKGLADVKCLACCQKNKFLAVGCDKKNKVLILKLSTNQNGGPEVHKTQTIELNSADIWAVEFDDSGALWVVAPSESQPVRVYVCNDQTNKYELMTSVTDGKGVLPIVEHLNTENKQLFQANNKATCGFETLHKVRIDNMKEYHERKQARIEQKNQKRHQVDKNGTTKCDVPQPKQAKCS